MKKLFLKTASAVALLCAINAKPAQAQWSLTGNTATNPATNFLGTTDAKALKFRTNNTVRMTLSSTGKIGIGTQAPVARLDVLGASTAPDNVISAVAKYAGPINMAAVYGSAFSTDSTGIGVEGAGGLYGVHGFSNSIGVLGEGYTGSYGYAKVASSNTTAYPTGTWGEAYGGQSANGVFGYADSSVQNVALWGIATDSATVGHTLSNIDFAAYLQGNCIAWKYYTVSDARLKRNITPLESSLDKLMKVKTATYDFKTDEYPKLYLPKERQVGFLADNLQEQFPLLVTDAHLPGKVHPRTGEVISQAADVKIVNYMGMIPVLTEAIQGQQMLIADKEAKIIALTNKLQALDARLAALESGQASGVNTKISSEKSSARLEQNNPNPFNQSTSIRFNIPEECKNAQLVVSGMNGTVLKNFLLTSHGEGMVTINGAELESGNYIYTLFVDGKVVDTRSLVLTK